MTIHPEPVDREELAARIDTLTDSISSMQGQSVELYLNRVVALAGGRGGRLDVNRLPEDDARELWELTDVVAHDNGLVWSDVRLTPDPRPQE